MQVPDVGFPENKLHTPKSVNHDLLNYRTTGGRKPSKSIVFRPIRIRSGPYTGTRSVHRFTRDDQAAWSHEPFIVR